MLSGPKSWKTSIITHQHCQRPHPSGAKSLCGPFPRASVLVGSRQSHLRPGRDEDHPGIAGVAAAAAAADRGLRRRVQACHHRAWPLWWTKRVQNAVSLHNQGRTPVKQIKYIFYISKSNNAAVWKILGYRLKSCIQNVTKSTYVLKGT